MVPLFLKGQRCLTDKCAIKKRKYPPGPPRKRRTKLSDYGVQLREKQKIKRMYGLMEGQFRRVFEDASRAKGVTSAQMMSLLERRLDNVVYRMGFASSRMQARQFVQHRHVTVNGKIVNIPSFLLRPGDIVAVRERSKTLEVITNSLAGNSRPYPWLEWDNNLMSGKFMSYPERQDIPENIREQLIVELYSK